MSNVRILIADDHELIRRGLVSALADMRTQLSRLGVGTAAPGVWIAPGHLAGEVSDMLRRLRLDGYAQLFRGEHLAAGGLPSAVRAWWDLDGLRDLYAAFLDRHRPLRARWSRRRRAYRLPLLSRRRPRHGLCP